MNQCNNMKKKNNPNETKEVPHSFCQRYSLNPCDYCLFGKHGRAFQKSSSRKPNVLDLGYSDMLLKKIHIAKNPVDIITKVVIREKLELCTELAGTDSN